MKKLKNINFKDSFKDKKFKYGGYATLMTAFVLAVLIIINLVVDQIPFKKDLTQNKLFSLSEQTYNIIDNLEQDIEIIGLYESGAENKIFDEILNKYRARNKKISIRYIDPIKDPTFASKYTKDGQNLGQGSYIVESGNRFKVISYYDLLNYSSPDQYGRTQAQSLAVEQRVTSAIHYVTARKLPTVYVLEGHMEQSLPYQLRQQMELENYEIKNLSLLTEDSVPEDADIIMVIAPQRDMTDDEEKILAEYLEKQGRAIFFMDIADGDMPNFEGLLKGYGVGLGKALVLEGDGNYYTQTPTLIVPKLESHEITSPMRTSGMRVLAYAAQGIKDLDVKKRSLEIQPLLTTSNSAWGRVNLSSTTIEKEEGDISGPFNIAVTVTDKVWNDKESDYDETKLVVVGDSDVLNAQFYSVGNADFVLNSLNWLQDEKESISIRPKSVVQQYLNINSFQALLYAGITVILIPLLVLGAGLIVWLRRRHL